jgi:hypothetical protein
LFAFDAEPLQALAELDLGQLPRHAVLVDPEPALQQFDQRQEGHRRPFGTADRLEQQHRLIAERLGEFEDQPRLAKPGVANHVDRPKAARLHHVPMLLQQGKLDVAAAQAGEPVPTLGAEPGETQAHRIEPVDFDALRLASELPRTERRRVDEALNHVERGAGDADRSRLGRGLKARGDIHRIAERAVGHGLALADLADHGGPGMDANAELRLNPVGCLKLVLQPEHPLLNVERGAAGSEPGILHGHRRPEHRHDAVPGEILHHPAIGLDRLPLFAGDAPCQREHGLLAQPLAHPREVHQVGEHDGQVAALPLHLEARKGLRCHAKPAPAFRPSGTMARISHPGHGVAVPIV